MGQAVALGLIYWGIWQVLNGNWANGLWMVFIGWFLQNSATVSYRQQVLRQMLSGHTVREVMMSDCPRFLPRLTLDVVMDHIVLPSGRRYFMMIEDDQVRGLLTLHRIKRVPRQRWTTTRVEDVMIPRSELKMVGPDDDLHVVFERMAAGEPFPVPVRVWCY